MACGAPVIHCTWAKPGEGGGACGRPLPDATPTPPPPRPPDLVPAVTDFPRVELRSPNPCPSALVTQEQFLGVIDETRAPSLTYVLRRTEGLHRARAWSGGSQQVETLADPRGWWVEPYAHARGCPDTPSVHLI